MCRARGGTVGKGRWPVEFKGTVSACCHGDGDNALSPAAQAGWCCVGCVSAERERERHTRFVVGRDEFYTSDF